VHRGYFQLLICATLAMVVIASAPFAVAAQDETTLQENGLVETGVYTSPQFGNGVEWTTDWTLDEEELHSDEQLLLDRLSVSYESDATCVIMFIEAAGETPDAYARRLVRFRRVTDETAQVIWSESTEESAVILYGSTLDGRDIVSLIEIRLVNDDDTLQVVELLSYAEYAEDMFDNVQNDIGIDGEPPFEVMTEFPADEMDS
jgi:hypothetical protein